MKNKKPGTVRIIGGEWRGTRLQVPDLPGLRPSGDRSRETLFNWLQMHIRGSRCADLFAGSGALGLEAASRGAAEVVLVEQAVPAARIIATTLERLKADRIDLIQADAIDWLGSCEAGSLDIVFIDPPFDSGLEVRALDLLAERNCVSRNGFVYIETARETPAFVAGPGWEIVKEKTLGEVRMMLLKKN